MAHCFSLIVQHKQSQPVLGHYLRERRGRGEGGRERGRERGREGEREGGEGERVRIVIVGILILEIHTSVCNIGSIEFTREKGGQRERGGGGGGEGGEVRGRGEGER